MAFVDAPYALMEDGPLFDAYDLPFAEVGVTVPEGVDAAIDYVNERYEVLGYEKFIEDSLAPLQYSDAGVPYFEYGNSDSKTAVAYFFPFEAGSDPRLNMRAYFLKEVLDHMDIVDRDGDPLRVIGFPSPAGGKLKGVDFSLPLGDIKEMLVHNDYRRYTGPQLATLKELGVDSLITTGFSLGGMLSPLVADHAISQGELNVLSVIAANNPGNGRLARTKVGALANCLHRLIQSGGDTVAEVHKSHIMPLIDMIPSNRRDGRELSAREVLEEDARMIGRVVVRPLNLGLWGVMSEASTKPAMEQILAAHIPLTYALSERDQIPFPQVWLPELKRLHEIGHGLLRVVAFPHNSHDIGSDPRKMSALFLSGVERGLATDQSVDIEDSALAA